MSSRKQVIISSRSATQHGIPGCTDCSGLGSQERRNYLDRLARRAPLQFLQIGRQRFEERVARLADPAADQHAPRINDVH